MIEIQECRKAVSHEVCRHCHTDEEPCWQHGKKKFENVVFIVLRGGLTGI
jgi:hypothetical protein